MIIRPETSEDYEAITQVTLAAFTGKFSDHPTEHLIILGLRQAGALSLSLVAEMNEGILGHAAFSPVTINGQHTGWYGLGPVSVQPGWQKQGIGSKLIQAGLARIRDRSVEGCVVLGSPEYYQRFGFKSYPQLIYEGAPHPKYFMAFPFSEAIPEGKVEYYSAFYHGGTSD